MLTFYKICRKFRNCGISWPFLKPQWKMHSDKHKHACYWFSNSWSSRWNFRNVGKANRLLLVTTSVKVNRFGLKMIFFRFSAWTLVLPKYIRQSFFFPLEILSIIKVQDTNPIFYLENKRRQFWFCWHTLSDNGQARPYLE